MQFAAAIALVLLQHVASDKQPAKAAIAKTPIRVELLATEAPALAVTLPRDERLRLDVVVTTPDEGSAVEDFEIQADDQQRGYGANRAAPNLFVTVNRLRPDGTREHQRVRSGSSGGGASLREHYVSIHMDLLESSQARDDRMRRFVMKAGAQELQPKDLQAAFLYLDPLYVANPVGTYEVKVEYQPGAGVFAGENLRRVILVTVAEGPDSLEHLLN
jgi:hypothetical protein